MEDDVGGEVQKGAGEWRCGFLVRKSWKARENVLGLGDSQCKGPETGVCQAGEEACIGHKGSEKAWVAIARPVTLTQSEEEHGVEHHLPCLLRREQTWVRAEAGRPARWPLHESRQNMKSFQSQIYFEGKIDRTC